MRHTSSPSILLLSMPLSSTALRNACAASPYSSVAGKLPYFVLPTPITAILFFKRARSFIAHLPPSTVPHPTRSSPAARSAATHCPRHSTAHRDQLVHRYTP